jgi:hypothetical protein
LRDVFCKTSEVIAGPEMRYLYFVSFVVFLVATTLCFKTNEPNRAAINAAVGHDGLLTPERKIPYYDAAYLNDFIEKANIRRALGMSALELYKRPTLLWIDVGFAICCAAFAALFWLGVGTLLNHHPASKHLMAFLIAMSLIYGVVDVAEDLWLVKLFSQDHKETAVEGGIACALTQTKIATISLSIVGGLLFKILDT